MAEDPINIKVGDILVNSIGGGIRIYHQVVKVTESFVTVREIEEKAINRNIKCQTCDFIPIKDKFVKTAKDIRLKLYPDGQIGPIKRLNSWYKL